MLSTSKASSSERENLGKGEGEKELNCLDRQETQLAVLGTARKGFYTCRSVLSLDCQQSNLPAHNYVAPIAT